jgi:NAD(P)-dependent dehydrogenase (short-subunit alcohol dehydrogenase family)
MAWFLLKVAPVLVLAVALICKVAVQQCSWVSLKAKNGVPLGKDKTIVITGANSGLGYYTALALAGNGARLVLACRSLKKGEQAKQDILKKFPKAIMDVMELNLDSFKSIRSFADIIKNEYSSIDVLVNNAGVMAMSTREETKDGLEAQMGVNHFGHFLLTSLLLPIINRKGRVINHSSMASSFVNNKFVFEDMQSVNDYSPYKAYGKSKISNLMFTYELNRRLNASGNEKEIISIAVHPGYTDTNLQTSDNFPGYQIFNKYVAMRGEDGALSQIVAAVGEDVSASDKTFIGPYLGMVGAPAVRATTSQSWDLQAQAKLWEESLRLTGAHFDL